LEILKCCSGDTIIDNAIDQSASLMMATLGYVMFIVMLCHEYHLGQISAARNTVLMVELRLKANKEPKSYP
jgi:hypothetical protein